MRRFILAAFVPFALAGCLNPLYSRMDHLSEQMAEMSAKLDESNKQLASLQGQLKDANTTISSFGGVFGFPGLPKKQ